MVGSVTKPLLRNAAFFFICYLVTLCLLIEFGIEDSLGLCCTSLSIPSLTRGKPQLSAFEVESTRKIASLRIHVESKWVGLL